MRLTELWYEARIAEWTINMLVLSRKRHEAVVIGRISGGDPMVTVTVLDIGAETVQIGFECSREVGICRSELLEESDAGLRADGLIPVDLGPTGSCTTMPDVHRSDQEQP